MIALGYCGRSKIRSRINDGLDGLKERGIILAFLRADFL
jgi:hypothetical protein